MVWPAPVPWLLLLAKVARLLVFPWAVPELACPEWEEVMYKESISCIPSFIQVTAHRIADGPAKADHSLYNEAQEKLRIEEEEEAARQAAAEAEAGG